LFFFLTGEKINTALQARAEWPTSRKRPGFHPHPGVCVCVCVCECSEGGRVFTYALPCPPLTAWFHNDWFQVTQRS